MLFAALGDHVLFLDGSINVSGTDHQGKPWFQMAAETEPEAPYENSYGYRATLDECTEENHGVPAQIYRWVYRCLAGGFSPAERAIFYGGAIHSFAPLTDEPEEGLGVLKIPCVQFPEGEHVKIAWRVLADNPLVACYLEEEGETVKVFRFAADPERLAAMTETMAASIAAVDGKISELYGFTPEAPPQTVEEKVKTAKVIWDWLRLNNVYGLDGEWEDQTVYSALSGGDRSPVCTSYARAAHLLLERFGIENVVCHGVRYEGAEESHAWNLVNYHDTPGDYTREDSQWCIFDATGTTGTIQNWDAFNRTWVEGEYVGTAVWYPLPTTMPLDGDHGYGGSSHYAWEE